MADLGAIGFDVSFGYLTPIVVGLVEIEPVLDEPTHRVTGVLRDDAGDPAAFTVRAYRRSDGRLLASATSDPVTGAYLLEVPDVEVQVVVLDADGAPLYNDLLARVLPEPIP